MKSLSVWEGWMKELRSSLLSEYFQVTQWIQSEYDTLVSFHFLDIWLIFVQALVQQLDLLCTIKVKAHRIDLVYDPLLELSQMRNLSRFKKRLLPAPPLVHRKQKPSGGSSVISLHSKRDEPSNQRRARKGVPKRPPLQTLSARSGRLQEPTKKRIKIK